jgi:DNA-directed RNA polymerase specialized sigma24 family protein
MSESRGSADRYAKIAEAFITHLKQLLQLAARIAGPDAEDAIHDAFLKACAHGGEPNNVEAYLRCIVKTAAITILRKKRRWVQLPEDTELLESGPAPEYRLAVAETRLLLLTLIDEELTGFEERELALDFLNNGSTNTEQAIKFGKDINNINVTKHHYMAKLKAAARDRGWTLPMFED